MPLKLSVLTLAELGFDSAGASLGQVYARAAKLGFELCPAEAGPQLRLQYMNQKLGEFLHIAMEPVVTAGGAPVIFVVANGGEGLALLSSDGHSGTVMPAASRFVFVKPQAVAMR